MKIDIYTSVRHGGKHLSVPAGTDLKQVTFPPDLDADLHVVSPFKAQFDTTDAALDAQDIEAQIAKSGYAVHGSAIVIEVFA